MRKFDRFMEYCSVKNLSINEVTKRLDISLGLLSKIKKEGKDLSPKLIGLISNTFNDLNINWLLEGKGEMLSSESANNTATMMIGRLKFVIKIMVKEGLILSQEDLGEKLGYSGKVYISRLINGKVDNKQFIEKLLVFNPSINQKWLFTGIGEPFKRDENTNDNLLYIAKLESEIKILREENEALKQQLEEYKQNDVQNLDNFFQLLQLMNEKIDDNSEQLEELQNLIKTQQSA